MALALLLAMTPVAFADAPVSKLTVLHTFNLTDGAFPAGELLEGADGVFYGVTYAGGAKDGGIVYKITSGGEMTTLFAFGWNATAFEGGGPNAGLVHGADGNLYGTTSLGGDLGGGIAGGSGTIFRMTESGTITVLHTFTGPDGANPFASLLLAADGLFYGSTIGGGAGGTGTIFKMTPAGAVSTLYAFALDASDGAQIQSPLIQAPDGVLYGSTHDGGYGAQPNAGGGTAFKLTLDGHLTNLHYFNYGDGSGPVVFGSDGALYGSTDTSQELYRLTPQGDFTQLHRFQCSCGTPEGAWPYGRLKLASDGKFYGTTSGGGVRNKGTIYSLTQDGVLTQLYSFTDTDGNNPNAGLTEGRDGRFYGVAWGGFPGYGTVFKLAFLPPAPAALTAVAGQGHITLNWPASKSANTYNVFRGTASGAENATPVLSGISATTADVTSLTNGTTYYFTVAATNEAGTGAQSVEAHALPTAVAAGLTATAGDGQVTLNWTNAEGASNYSIYQGTVANVSTTTPVRTAVTATSATLTGLTNGTAYFFKVVSVYGMTPGPASAEVSATPVKPAAPTPPPSSGSSGGGGGGAFDGLVIVLLGLVAMIRHRFNNWHA